jgi:hypothetical protein
MLEIEKPLGTSASDGKEGSDMVLGLKYHLTCSKSIIFVLKIMYKQVRCNIYLDAKM